MEVAHNIGAKKPGARTGIGSAEVGGESKTDSGFPWPRKPRDPAETWLLLGNIYIYIHTHTHILAYYCGLVVEIFTCLLEFICLLPFQRELRKGAIDSAQVSGESKPGENPRKGNL